MKSAMLPAHQPTLLFHRFNLARAPRLGEEWPERAVEAQDREPALAGNGALARRVIEGVYFNLNVRGRD